MNDEYLDGLIDTAAEQMVKHEPSRLLGEAVMSRVSESSDQPRRSFAVGSGFSRAATIAAAVAVCVFLLTVVLNRTPRPATTVDSSNQATAVKPPAESALSSEAAQQRVDAQTMASAERRRNTARKVRPSPLRAPFVDDVFAAETSVVFEPIAPAPIDVPVLQVNETSVDAIEIAPLAVEPLTASND